MRMSCINIHNHPHISSLIAHSFNFTILFLEELLNLPQTFSSRRHTKVASRFVAPEKVTSSISQNSAPSWALLTSLCWFWHSVGHPHEPRELGRTVDKQVQWVAASVQRKGQNTYSSRRKPPFSGHKSLDWLSCALKQHL